MLLFRTQREREPSASAERRLREQGRDAGVREPGLTRRRLRGRLRQPGRDPGGARPGPGQRQRSRPGPGQAA